MHESEKEVCLTAPHFMCHLHPTSASTFVHVISSRLLVVFCWIAAETGRSLDGAELQIFGTEVIVWCKYKSVPLEVAISAYASGIIPEVTGEGDTKRCGRCRCRAGRRVEFFASRLNFGRS